MKRLSFFSKLAFLISLFCTHFPVLGQYKNSQYVDIEGIKIHYRIWEANHEQAKKGKVLMIHGFCGSTFCWRKNIDTLTNSGYTVVAVDLPPFGHSDKRSGINHSISAQAELMGVFMDFFDATHLQDTSQWVLVGHSMGAAVSGAILSNTPENIRACVLVDGLVLRPMKEPNFWRKALASPTAYRFGELAGKFYFFKPKKIHKLLITFQGQIPEKEVVEGYLSNLNAKGTAGGILEMSASSEKFAYSEQDIKIPMLIIWGEKDVVIPIENAEKFRPKVPHAEYVKITGAGHCSMETHSKEVNAAIMKFLGQ
ncbi:MAG: alpha/beta fold hydrolase [Bacteroidia bacterium]